MTTSAFITVDGLDGCGKSTQLHLLSKHLDDNKIENRIVSDLGSSELGKTARTLINKPDADDPVTDALLVYAARLVNLRMNVEPLLARGSVVLADRYSLTTLAYNVEGSGVPEDIFHAMENYLMTIAQPTLSIVLDVDPTTCISRISDRAGPLEKYEQKPIGFYKRVRDSFLKSCELGNAVLIDGSGSVEEVHSRIKSLVAAYL